MEKIPCIKCTPELWKYIESYLREWGYHIFVSSAWNIVPLLVINDGDKFGTCNNYDIGHASAFNRELVTDVEEFLERAAKLKGFTYKRKNIMKINGIEIKPGMVLCGLDIYGREVEAIVVPIAGGVAFGSISSSKWSTNYKDLISAELCSIRGLSKGVLIDGDILWEKRPKVFLTLSSISDKLGVPLKFLDIEGFGETKRLFFNKEDLKPGMVVEVEMSGFKSLAIVTNWCGGVCLSNLDFSIDTRTITGALGVPGGEITAIYGLSFCKDVAYELDTKYRELLWDRKYVHLYSLREIADAFGISVEQVEIVE